MKAVLTTILFLSTALAMAQAPKTSAEGMKAIDFLAGTWKGTQKFNPMGGAAMEASVVNETKAVVGGRFFEEALAVDLNGKKSDTRHLTTYDPKSGTYKAWWFNDTRASATEFEGKLEGDKLSMVSKPVPGPGGAEVTLKVTYQKLPNDSFSYGLEMKQGENWVQLFVTVYARA